MNLLFSKLVKQPSIHFFEKWGVADAFDQRGKKRLLNSLPANHKDPSTNIVKSKERFESKVTTSWGDKEVQLIHSKPKELARWATWIDHQSSSRTMETKDLKPIWNYLLGESGFSDLLSFIFPDQKESFQMVVEPKNKGLVLYVFWESKETGAMGIQFHYDPEKEKPILLEITTEQSIQGENFSKSLAGLVRDFPQIQSVQIETWSDESFNGDYR
ncbi:hypothetical protein ACO2KH_00760 [Leptospira terpstrae]|uniref:hypothetical protein n=1 Tax=Leptospira terpstrae TaxID=293075 RepID=UPI003D09075E